MIDGLRVISPLSFHAAGFAVFFQPPFLPRLPVRHRMVAGTFVLATIVLFDRIMISVAREPVVEALDLTDKQWGWVLSVFALGYALFQAPAGYAADRFGARRLLTVVVSLWSAFTALTGAVTGFVQLIVVRFLFGAGEAGAFPGIARAVYRWIPTGERGVVNGVNFSGGRLGGAVALVAMPALIDWAGWRLAFVYLGAVGVAWALWWWWWFRDDPAAHGSVGAAELAVIEANTEAAVGPVATPSGPVSLSAKRLLADRNMLLLAGQYFASNFTFYFTLSWLFPYLRRTYELTPAEAGAYSAATLIAGALGNWASGWLVDRLYVTGSLARSRRVPAIAGFVLAAAGVLASVYMTSPGWAVVALGVAVFGADMTLSPSWSACVDVGQAASGTVSGTMNMAGNIGSFATSLPFPYLLAAFGSPTPFFFLAAGLNALAIVAWMGIRPERAIGR